MIIGNGLSLELGKYQTQVDLRLRRLQNRNFAVRLWNKEARLWIRKKNTPVQSEISGISLGWLNVVSKMQKALPALENFSETIIKEGFEYAVLLGMGGSSMAPFVFQEVFKSSAKGIKLIVLDTTEAAAILKAESKIDLSKTLFIVSSKSGNTAEVILLYKYFLNLVSKEKKENPGKNFIAITDEGSPLAQLAAQNNFRKTFINFSDIGGRFSALSYFGLVPAALMGVNVNELLKRTQLMIEACGPEVPVAQNPGMILGATIAELALSGYNKLTYLMPPSLEAFGTWLEQLIAESTGKNGKGILPLNGSPLAEINSYGKDRLFFQMGFLKEKEDLHSEKVKNILSIKFPVIDILIENELDMGAEFFRWEMATVVAGSILGINPFNQPNVEESKKCTTELLRKTISNGKFPVISAALTENKIRYYAAEKVTDGKSLLEHLFSTVKPGDFAVLQVYLPEEPEVIDCLQEIQISLQKTLNIAVCIQFGPRYLHSTGQYHKGGPNNGHFIQLMCDAEKDLPIPGESYTFSTLKKAQASGDMQALIKYNRK
ncbi:MAG: hypothetical protein IAF38_21460, partial [Bacteroidia bacterium]|nr:hypothetical protein [Bacteroidia bacterium]